ncbi:PQQ-dependent sugar dehydrogenase [Antarcticirhabdus aurantiaca]|uniref:PQQ-dependent sugar dehydrogenase n=1 Tax=Antarcticirhabdus aurantiaca TaxID=2606717 RepID=A0ACD4NPH9_9HYPH|nr:PQQ-dependent sugar dehydrogenase [Antarcticirhabdus aurantiaca]WAJ28622.1 PQQ-dependent sugar dehydrogenase [Jeongeuplla avenae]
MSLRLSALLAGTALAAGLSLSALPALAQSTGDTSPIDHVEGTPPATGEENTAATAPVETEAPNAQGQEPAFAGQTRAPQSGETPEVKVETVAEGLPHLWAMEFLPDGRMLVTAKEGAMHIVTPEGEVGPAISGVPEVVSGGQAGLLDVALAPDFETSRHVFVSFSEPRDEGNGTSVARGTLSADGTALEDVEVVFRQMPSYDNTKHYGSRLVFSADGHLYVTVGERSDDPIREQAQNLESGLGKVFRINVDGSAAEGNPFADGANNAQPEIWSYGHRNLQSAALDGEGRLWTVEHGPRGGDELNRPEAGKNYGWPVITYGVEYSGGPVEGGLTAQDGMEQPVYYWDPVVGPSGMAWYEGAEFPEWQNAFLVGGLVSTGLVVLHMEDGRVAAEDRVSLDARIRDVRVGPDGAVYAVTEDPRAGSSTILRVTRQGA